MKFAAGMATGLVAGFWCGQFWAFSRFIAGEAAKVDTAIAEIRAGRDTAAASSDFRPTIVPGYNLAAVDLAELAEWAQSNTSADLFADRRRFREVVALVDMVWAQYWPHNPRKH